ncbi:hypothetical protein [Sulfobacillus harzensis]|uniref:Tetratricopeptide repeat protein n=1 Tax=Sulfobacillus harzensis TaxID=2729629 RepID=A0A7Y0L4Q7_9FIRM|nr:hypothetical protein [Sulfobacillus harzensis]NMP23277.1 hypothetical protein [Sulfobacillus harzensis]
MENNSAKRQRRSAPWLQHGRVGRPVPAPLGARWRHILLLQRMGRTADAYRLAISSARLATQNGNDVAARRLAGIVTELQRYLPTDAQLFHGVAALEDEARRAVRQDRWQEALAVTNRILEIDGLLLPSRRRAKVNRATLLTTLGRFAEAVLAYDAIKEDHQVWNSIEPMRRMALRLARLSALNYDQGATLESVQLAQKVAPHFGKSPSLWQLYWWIMSHAVCDRLDRLESVRRASLRTFNPDWDWTVDRLLWGIDLRIGWHENRPYFERRIHLALEDPSTLVALGRSGWMDLKADWLNTLIDEGDNKARAHWEDHVAWCEDQGYDGWAAYWHKRQPQ